MYLVNNHADSRCVGVTLRWDDPTKVSDVTEEIPWSDMLLCFSIYSNQSQLVSLYPRWTVKVQYLWSQGSWKQEFQLTFVLQLQVINDNFISAVYCGSTISPVGNVVNNQQYLAQYHQYQGKVARNSTHAKQWFSTVSYFFTSAIFMLKPFELLLARWCERQTCPWEGQLHSVPKWKAAEPTLFYHTKP